MENVGVEQRAADVVQLALQHVEITVQTAGKNFVNGAELQFGAQPAGKFFGVVAKFSLGHAGNFAERVVEFVHAKTDRARKILVEQQKFRDEPRADFRAVNGFVGVPRAARAQNGGPFERVGFADGLRQALRGKRFVAQVENARGFVGALDKFADLREPPAFVVNERRVSQADDVQRTGFDLLKKFRRAVFPRPVAPRACGRTSKGGSIPPTARS